MVNSQHLKRHKAPTSWKIKRKNITFIAKPKSGSHKREYVVSLVVLLRDILNFAETSKEVKLILNDGQVLVNGKQVKDVRYPVGIFDVFEIKSIDKKYVVLFDEFGKIKLVSQKDDLIYLKVSQKSILKNSQFQISFMNGFNILVEKKKFDLINVNDSVVFDFVKKQVVKILNLKKDCFVYFFNGKFTGCFGEVEGFVNYNGVSKDVAEVKINGLKQSTAKDYLFVLGNDKKDLKRFE